MLDSNPQRGSSGSGDFEAEIEHERTPTFSAVLISDSQSSAYNAESQRETSKQSCPPRSPSKRCPSLGRRRLAELTFGAASAPLGLSHGVANSEVQREIMLDSNIVWDA